MNLIQQKATKETKILARARMVRTDHSPPGYALPGSALWLSICIIAISTCLSKATPVLFTVKGHQGEASGLQVNIKPKNNPFVSGLNIFAGSEIVTNLSGGQVLVELVPDDYTVIFGGVAKSFGISVFDTNVVVRAETLSTNLATYVYTNLLGQISSKLFAGANISLGTNAAGTPLESITISAGGTAITALTGDVTAAGPGSASATLATVATPGTSTKVTYNGKGLVTSGTTLSAGDIPSHTHIESDVTGLVADLAAKAPSARSISTTSPLSGGGDLSADRTLSIANAAADGATKGAASFTAADFDAASGNISLDYVNGQKASGSVNGFLSSVDWNAFNNKVGTARSINTTAPLSGGGDLSADRTLSIANAAADGATKGAASFTGADFDASSGNISLDYVNGQKASGSVNGFLSSADYTTFNGKQAAGNYITALTSDVTASGPGSAAATIANNAVTFPKIVNATATQRAMGRNTAGSGNWEEVTATQMLDWIGSTRGSVLYRGSGGWTILTPGASGTLLQSQGAGADPFWSSHLVGTGTAPTAVTNVAAGGGSVLTLDASAHDTACRITIITGAAPTTGLIFRLTYGTAYPSVPHVVWSATSIASGQLITRTYVSNITASAFDFYCFGSALIANTNHVWDFHTIQ